MRLRAATLGVCSYASLLRFICLPKGIAVPDRKFAAANTGGNRSHPAMRKGGAAIRMARACSLGVTAPAALQLFPLGLGERRVDLLLRVNACGPHLLPECFQTFVCLADGSIVGFA